MEKLTLTPEQAMHLVSMLADHAEWSDPLSAEDRLLYSILDSVDRDMPKIFDRVKGAKIAERQEAHARQIEANKAAKK